MTKKKEKESFFEKINNWSALIAFIVALGTGVGTFMVSDYRHEQHEKNDIEIKESISKLSDRVKVTESINYELIMQQLQDIQDANKQLNDKLEKTDERIDKVLEILVSK